MVAVACGALAGAGCASITTERGQIPSGQTEAGARPSPAQAECRGDAPLMLAPAQVIEACTPLLRDPRATVRQFAVVSLRIGEAHLARQELDAAGASLSRALDLSAGLEPTMRGRILNAVGRLRQARGERQQAIAAFKAAADLDPADPRLLFDLGSAQLADGMSTQALAVFDRLFALARTQTAQTAGFAGQARLQLGAWRLTGQSYADLQMALEAYEAALAVRDVAAEAQLGVGAAQLRLAALEPTPAERATRLAGALKAYEAAEQARPDAAEAWTGQGRTRLALGQTQLAIAAFARAAGLEPATADRLGELARIQAQARQYDDAAQTYAQWLALDPNNAALLGEFADVEIARGQPDKARALLERAIRIDRSMPALSLQLAKLLYANGGAAMAVAREQFLDAARLAAASSDKNARAEALYFVSRIDTEGRGVPLAGAIANADAAVTLDGARSDYRSQACLARIRFMTLDMSRSGEANAHCGDLSGATPAQSYLLRGMKELRAAHFAGGDDKKRRWEEAYRAFLAGRAALRADDVAVTRAGLELGVGLANYCVGFAAIGREMIDRIDKDTRTYFDTYRVAQCATY
jgi:tetratricopeptide (TPR) repeat protein